MSYVCPGCDGQNEVTLLITSLKTGSTIPSCEADTPIMLITQLAGWLEVDPQRLYDSVQRFSKREAQAAVPKATHEPASPPSADPPGPEDDPGEDGNTDYGQGDADDLNDRLAAEDESEATL